MIQIVVEYLDHSRCYFRVDDVGWRFDATLRQLIIGRGVPRQQVPLDNVRHYTIEEVPDNE